LSLTDQWREAEILGQIAPLRVVLLEQVQFPRALPFLEALFAGDRVFHCRVLLEPDEAVGAVACGEAAESAFAVLVDALEQV